MRTGPGSSFERNRLPAALLTEGLSLYVVHWSFTSFKRRSHPSTNRQRSERRASDRTARQRCKRHSHPLSHPLPVIRVANGSAFKIIVYIPRLIPHFLGASVSFTVVRGSEVSAGQEGTKRNMRTVKEKCIRVQHELVVGVGDHAGDLASSFHLPQLQESARRGQETVSESQMKHASLRLTPCSA